MKQLVHFLGKRKKQAVVQINSSVIDEKTVFFIFHKIIDEQYGQRGKMVIFPVKFDGKVLVLRVASPLWAQEILIQRSVLCERVNRAFEQEVLLDLKISHGLSGDLD